MRPLHIGKTRNATYTALSATEFALSTSPQRVTAEKTIRKIDSTNQWHRIKAKVQLF
jgi:hypothetical protein